MSLPTASKVFGSHNQFFISGGSFTVPSAGTCSRTSKPGATDTGWVDLGTINDLKFSPPEVEKIEVWEPSPGQLQKGDSISTKVSQKGTFTAKQFSPLILQALFRTANLTSASTQFNPHEGGDIKGWMKWEAYDQDNVLALVGDFWIELKLASDVDFGGSALAEANFEFEILRSTLNTGSIYPA